MKRAMHELSIRRATAASSGAEVCIAGVMTALLLSLTPAACVHPPNRPLQDGSALPPEFARVLSDYESAWQAQDAAGLAELFTEDGFVLANGHAPVRGRVAIRGFYSGQGGPLALRAIAWAREGSVGYIIGGYARERGADEIGKFTLTLARTPDGRWWIVSDMDNGNAPSR